MKKTLFFILGYLSITQFLSAQITTNETPLSFDIAYSQTLRSISIHTLPVPDLAKINADDKINDALPDGPLRFAFPVKVNYTLTNSGTWQTLEDGSKLWRLSVKLPRALSTNTIYDTFQIPKGAKFFVYSEETKQCIGAITSEYLNNNVAPQFAFSTGIIYGETVAFEYYQPVTVQEEAKISISRIDYGYRYINNPYALQPRSFGDSGDCQVNINCPEGDNWKMEKDAIARMLIVSDSGSGWCSCALVNNTNNDNTPYVLTADHCLKDRYGNYLFDAYQNNNASQWMFYWNYEHPGCSNGAEPTHKSTVGATVVANNAVSDFALLQLTQDPGNLTGFMPYYLGWDRSGNSGAGGVGIHHPRGDVKKISTLNGNTSNNWNGRANYWSHYWNQTANGYSVTEGGSSGSPLINNEKRVIGQLYGGSNINCSNPSQDIAAYGKFSVSWTGDNNQDSRRRLRDWLDPAGTNPQTLNGMGMYDDIRISGSTTVCNQATYTIENLPAGATVQWGASPGVSIQTVGNKGVVLHYNYVTGKITAKVYLGGTELLELHKNITVGLPQFSIVASENCFYMHGEKGFGFSAYPIGDSGDLFTESIDYYWSCKEVDTGFEIFKNTFYNTSFININPFISFPRSGRYRIEMYARKNGTCSSPIAIYDIYIESNCVESGYGSFSLSPNPATDMVTVELQELEPESRILSLPRSPDVYEIQLWSASSMLRRYTTDRTEYQIPVSGLPAGIYFVRVIKDGQTYTKKLIKR